MAAICGATGSRATAHSSSMIVFSGAGMAAGYRGRLVEPGWEWVGRLQGGWGVLMWHLAGTRLVGVRAGPGIAVITGAEARWPQHSGPAQPIWVGSIIVPDAAPSIDHRHTPQWRWAIH